MATPAFHITGIDHLRWEYGAVGEDSRDVIVRFVFTDRPTFPKALNIVRLQMSDWFFTEGFYNYCDEVRVFDLNNEGAQLEFGRFQLHFFRHGEMVGQHVADSVAVR